MRSFTPASRGFSMCKLLYLLFLVFNQRFENLVEDLQPQATVI